jgi:hypothetical protein
MQDIGGCIQMSEYNEMQPLSFRMPQLRMQFLVMGEGSKRFTMSATINREITVKVRFH